MASGPSVTFLFLALELFAFFLLSCFGCFNFLVYFMYRKSISFLGFVDGVSAETFEVGNGVLYHFNRFFVIA